MEGTRRGPLAITGMGQVSAAGTGIDALAKGLRRGDTGIVAHPSEHFPQLAPWLAVAPGWSLDDMPTLRCERPQAYALGWARTAVNEAIARARLLDRVAADRVALLLGLNLTDFPRTLHGFTAELARLCGIEGPSLAVAGACASSGLAVTPARDWLESGNVDAAVVGGCDVITPRVVAGFSQMGILADDGPCSPFSSRVGTSLGQGAAFLVLERLRDAPAPVRYVVLGEGKSSDAYHATAPDPGGTGLAAAMQSAMRRAGVDRLDYVNAHGTGTQVNDVAEAKAIARALGPEAADVPVSGTKSVTGHCLAAASMIELVTTLVAADSECLPPTLNFVEPPRNGAPDRIVRAGTRGRWRQFCCNSAGFGGYNSAVVVGTASSNDATPVFAQKSRPVFIESVCLLRDDELDSVSWRRAVRGVDLRRVPELARRAILAADRVRGDRPVGRDSTTGLVAAFWGPSQDSVDRLSARVERDGLARVPASTFVESLPSHAAGWVATQLRLRGPLFTILGGNAGLWRSVILAASELGGPLGPERMLVVAADSGESDQPWTLGVALAHVGRWQLLGHAVGGVGDRDVLARACAAAKVQPRQLELRMQLRAGPKSEGLVQRHAQWKRALEQLAPGETLGMELHDAELGRTAMVVRASHHDSAP